MKTISHSIRAFMAWMVADRAVVLAVLLGPLVGVALALAPLAAQEAKPEAKNAVTIDNFTFSPQELTVPVGTTVTWVNHDDIPHSIVETDKKFRSKALDTDDSYAFTFAAAGTFNYFCGLHPHMTGKVIVKP